MPQFCTFTRSVCVIQRQYDAQVWIELCLPCCSFCQSWYETSSEVLMICLALHFLLLQLVLSWKSDEQGNLSFSKLPFSSYRWQYSHFKKTAIFESSHFRNNNRKQWKFGTKWNSEALVLLDDRRTWNILPWSCATDSESNGVHIMTTSKFCCGGVQQTRSLTEFTSWHPVNFMVLVLFLSDCPFNINITFAQRREIPGQSPAGIGTSPPLHASPAPAPRRSRTCSLIHLCANCACTLKQI